MRELLSQIEDWLKEDQPTALATVIETWGSSPRPVGAGMGITSAGKIAGSVSGGCVEGAVIDAAYQVLETGTALRLHFGVADGDAWEVGLSCGGEIEVFVRVFGREQLRIWQEGCQAKQTFCSVLLIEGREKQLGKELIILEDGRILGEVFSDSARKEILGAAQEVMRAGKSTCKELAGEELGEIFFHLVHPQPTLILVGGVHIALPLIKLAEVLEFEVVVIDPRKLFGTAERFPEVSALLTEWPDAAFQKVDLNRSTAVVTLTHDPKIDDPALKAALASPAFYIGALGSRKTHQQRKRRLVEDGFNQEQLQRVHAPVGLDLGGRSPQEIALSIMAEVVKAFNSAGQGS